MEPEIGSILEGKVTTITKFGAFVALENGKSGLVHISEIANSFVNDVHDFLQEGAAVRVKVLSNESGKINLSIKKALPQESRPAFQRPFQQRPPSGGGPRPAPAAPAEATFEDKLKLFMTSSEGRMADHRNREAKRGGGGSKRHK
ncbi:MAG: S1 RNA-binding domain-containing protein [Oscillibacter sp.]